MIVLVIGFAFWAGVRNFRERKAGMQRTQEKVMTLQKNSPEEANAAAPGSELHGKPAPAFTLKDLDGKKVTLAQFKGHPVVVNFWATWCGPCKLEMPWFEEFSHKYQDKGLVIL